MKNYKKLIRIIKKYKHHLLPVLLIIMIIVSIVIKTEPSKLAQNESIDISTEWLNANTNEPITVSEMEVESGETVIIKTKLPDNLNDLSTIGFYDRGFFIVGYIEGIDIFQCGDTFSKEIGKEQSSAWRFIELKKEYSNKYLVLAIQNNDVSKMNFSIESFVYGSMSDMANIIAKDNVYDVIIFGLCIIAGIFLLITAVGLKKVEFIESARKVTFLALLTIDIGLWVLSYDCFFQLIFANPSIRYSISYATFILFPILLINYYKDVDDENATLFQLVYNSYIILMSASVLAYIFRIIHISDTIFITHIFILVTLLLIGHSSGEKYAHTKNKDNLFELLIAAFADLYIIPCLIIYYLTYSEWIAINISIGYAAFLIMIMFTQVKKIRKQFNNAKIENEYKAIVRIEGVTNGNSRVVAIDKMKDEEFFAKGNPWFLHMDLIDFSSINVSLGWENGNTILRDIYNENDKLLNDNELQCSIGDSDFIFLLAAERNIDLFCQELSDALSRYIDKKWNNLYLKAKFSAKRVQKNESIDTILDKTIMAYHNGHADYHKLSNCYFYNDLCAESVKNEFIIESKMEKAIDNNEFIMFLQPKISTEDEECVGAEALIRWKSPEEGLISPGVFIPVAEKSGQIAKLDEIMFRKVCEYLSYRRDHNMKPVTISVNVSKKDISRDNFFSTYERIIKETNAPLQNLEFEFTESSAYEDIDAISTLIRRIHELGATASMDDFGTSYSNFGAMSKLNFDIIKMDKIFFDSGFPNDEKAYKLVKGIVEMFKNLKIKLVCEGIETKEQVDKLKELKVELIQGFYYSKPLSIEEFEEYLGDQV